MGALDAFAAACLVPLAIAAVVSGLDELVLDVVTAWRWLRGLCTHDRAAGPPPPDVPEKRIAIFLPLWQEEAVVGSMLAHNIGAIRYSEYHFFVGVYPNDSCTMDAVREAEVRFPNVHLCHRAAQRPHLQGRLPELDLPEHAGTRGGLRGSLRPRRHARRRGRHPSQQPALDQPLRGGLRHGAGSGAAALHAISRLHPRGLLRRIRGVPNQGRARPPGVGRIPALQRGRHGVYPQGARSDGGLGA